MADRTSTVRVNVLTDASSAGASIGKFGKLAGVAALGAAGLAVGGAVAANALYTFADAGDDANVSIEQGIKTMGLFGKASQDVAKRVQDQAKAISNATAVDINSIKATQAKLLTFKELAKTADEAGGNFDRATQAAVDLAAKGFGTAETNAVQLGKALNDPVKGLTALSRAGITFTDQEKERIATLVESNRMGEAQALVLKNIESQVGGTAEATAGGFEKMKNSVSIFAQELAQKALPYLDRFGTFMLEKGFPAIQKFGTAVAERVVPALQRFAGFIQDKVIPVAQQLIGWIVDHLVPAYQTVLEGALEGARGMFKNVADAVDKNREPLRDMGEKLKKVGEFLVDKVLPKMGTFYKEVLPALGTAIGGVITYLSDMYTAWQNVAGAIQNVIDKIQAVKDKWDALPGPLKGVAGAVGGRVAAGGGIDGGLGQLSSDLRNPTGARQVVVNLPGGFVGDEVTLARSLKAILAADDVRLNTAGV